MKSIVKEQSVMAVPGTKGYVVMGQNLEYNDDTYSQWGEILANHMVYPSIEEAKAHFMNILKNHYGYMRLYEIDEYQWGEAINHPLFAAYETLSGPMHNNEATLSDYIDWLSQFNNSVDAETVKALPPYLCVYEVEYK